MTKQKEAAAAETRPSGARRWFNAAVTLVLLVGAVVLMQHALRDVQWAQLSDDLADMPVPKILHAALWAAISYGALTFYDFTGVRAIRRGVSYGRVAGAALLAYSISHTLGFPAVTGGAVRYRLYSRWGVSAIDVARVMGLAGVTLLAGLFLVGGAALAWHGGQRGLWGEVPAWAMRGLGFLLLSLVALYLASGFLRRSTPVRFFGMTLPLPRPAIAFAQVAAGTADWLAVGTTLYVLLPPDAGLSYGDFIGIFVSAYMLGTISNVPGGLGVFDSLMLVALTPEMSVDAVLSSLLVYRAIYYLVPFAIGGLVFFGAEILPRHRRLPDAARPG